MTAPKLIVAIRALSLCLAVALTGCSLTADDGYLAPPDIAAFDRSTALQWAHRELGAATYQQLTQDTECREFCDVFQRGFEQARHSRIVLPALVDRYREAERVSS